MTVKQIKEAVSYCGLLCCFCAAYEGCSCKQNNNCKCRLSLEGCHQYTCCRDRGINGCWECPDFPCYKVVINPQRFKLVAFAKCIREDGLEKFAQYILRDNENGIIYNRHGRYMGDYDLESENDILDLLRKGRDTYEK